MNSALPTIDVYVYVCGKRSVALVDSVCSLTIVNRKLEKDTW